MTKLAIVRAALRVLLHLGTCWALLALLAHGLFPGAAWVVFALAIYTTVPLIVFAVARGWPFYPRAAFRLLVVRPFWYVQLVLPFVSGAAAIGLLAGFPFGASLLVGRVLCGLVACSLGGMLIAGYLGSRRLVVRDVEAQVAGMPAEFDGLRITQLSDLHIGPHSSRSFLSRVVRTVAASRPDLIAVTGDLVDDRAEDVAPYAAALGALDAPLGVFMIPGNHDVYAGWDEVESGLRGAIRGRVLVNEAHLIERNGATLAVLGTGDPAARRFGSDRRAAPNVERALAHVPAGATVVAFAHNPALWPSLAERGVALTLSGHTHWGQFALPRLDWSLASPFLRHAMGGHQDGRALLYIHPGTGYWGIPFRLGAFPEVTVVTLRCAPSAALRVGEARAACRRAA
jgi:predicted MPP superfamily phosphohydrolase